RATRGKFETAHHREFNFSAESDCNFSPAAPLEAQLAPFLYVLQRGLMTPQHGREVHALKMPQAVRHSLVGAVEGRQRKPKCPGGSERVAQEVLPGVVLISCQDDTSSRRRRAELIQLAERKANRFCPLSRSSRIRNNDRQLTIEHIPKVFRQHDSCLIMKSGMEWRTPSDRTAAACDAVEPGPRLPWHIRHPMRLGVKQHLLDLCWRGASSLGPVVEGAGLRRTLYPAPQCPWPSADHVSVKICDLQNHGHTPATTPATRRSTSPESHHLAFSSTLLHRRPTPPNNPIALRDHHQALTVPNPLHIPANF